MDKQCDFPTYWFSSHSSSSEEVGGPTRLSVTNVLRRILVMTSTMALLPPECKVMMRLTYYDDGLLSFSFYT